ncbi:hypothetical protein KI387_007512, partial [Taxus chinensis]
FPSEDVRHQRKNNASGHSGSVHAASLHSGASYLCPIFLVPVIKSDASQSRARKIGDRNPPRVCVPHRESQGRGLFVRIRGVEKGEIVTQMKSQFPHRQALCSCKHMVNMPPGGPFFSRPAGDHAAGHQELPGALRHQYLHAHSSLHRRLPHALLPRSLRRKSWQPQEFLQELDSLLPSCFLHYDSFDMEISAGALGSAVSFTSLKKPMS